MLRLQRTASFLSNTHSLFSILSDHGAVLTSISVPIRTRPPGLTKIIRPCRSIASVAFSTDILSSSLYTLPSTNLPEHGMNLIPFFLLSLTNMLLLELLPALLDLINLLLLLTLRLINLNALSWKPFFVELDLLLIF